MSLANSYTAERRHWPRVAEELLVAYRSKSHVNETVYFTRNISGGGLVFDSPESIPPETQLEMECDVPVDCERRTRHHMLVGARVGWIREIPEALGDEGSNRYRIGVAFDEIDSQDQVCLDEYVRKRLMIVSTQSIT